MKQTLGTAERPQSEFEFELNLRLSQLPLNDIGNAERLIRRFGCNILWAADSTGKGAWFWWNGKHWDSEQGYRQARLLAQRTAELVPHEIETVVKQAKGRRGKHVEFKKLAMNLRTWATKSGNDRNVEAMLRMAAPRLQCHPADLDSNKFLFNILNGTLELQPAEDGGIFLRPWRREDRITRISKVNFDPDATCENMRAFLDRILPDPTVQLFVQVFMGYCLTGQIDEQCIFIFGGSGQNGKSTLLNVQRGIYGTYCQGIPPAALMERRHRSGSEPNPELARLAGARLVLASEPERNSRLSTSTIKTVTGGEPIPIRDLYRGYFEMMPQFKLILTSNDRPDVPAADHGTWRRLHMIEFTVQIPAEERIPHFEDVLLKEASGILNLVLDGLRVYFEKGLQVPEAVKLATSEYKDDSDVVGQFLEVATFRVSSATESVSSADLYRAYLKYCSDNEIDPLSRWIFGRALTARGMKKSKSSIVRYRGLVLVDPYSAESK